MRVQIISVFLCLSLSVQSQNSLNTSISDPYYESLKLYLKRLKEYGINNSNDTVFFKQNIYHSDYSGIIDGINIKMLNPQEIHEKTNKRRSIGVNVINALEFNDGIASINVVGFTVSRKRKHYLNINGGHIKVKLTYDCEVGDYNYEIVDSH